ncbi:MAG: hypothetical protein RLZZ76_696 [Candidatus Parcubacteria bacterium]|jgi:thiol-disulfide isomerase/thioredoxin
MNNIVIGVIAVALGLGGLFAYTSSQKHTQMEEKMEMEAKAMMEKEKMEVEKKAVEEKAMMEKEAMMKGEGEDAMMKKDEAAMMMKKGSYEAYSASKLALAEKGDVVLFFKASWCPTCKALDADIKANAGSITEGVTILEVNYDTETALKQKYGVTSQHTLVQVDKDGKLISKWSGSPTLAALQTKIQ